MSFWRQQEERLAVRFLTWQYQKQGIVVPPVSELKRQASHLVDEAHRIAAKRGGNVVSILKAMIADLRKK